MRALWQIGLVILACVSVLGQPQVAQADAASILAAEQRAIARINLAARQRYLVQKTAKAGCYALTSHNPAENARQAWDTMTAFDVSFEALVKGDPERDLVPETDPATLDRIRAALPNWHVFSAATRQIVSGDWHTVPMSQVLRLNNTVLDEVNAAVDQIVATHSADLATQKAYAATVNLAGRQRMLVQKAAKELCFISLEIETENMRAALARTVELFETSLFALENGDFDMSIIDPPSLAVLVKISDIREMWASYRAPLQSAADGKVPTSEEVAFVEATSGPLFELSNDLVQLYVKK